MSQTIPLTARLRVEGISIVVPEAIKAFYYLVFEVETTEACSLELWQVPVERDAFAGSNLGGSSLAYDCRGKKSESGEPFLDCPVCLPRLASSLGAHRRAYRRQRGIGGT